MNAWLDDLISFEEKMIDVKSLKRDSIERSAAGLDGVISIDLGSRDREIIQRGILRGVSIEQLRDRISVLRSLMDGQTHKLRRADGQVFENVRLDMFEADEVKHCGAGVWCEFEVRYTQLRDR